MKIRAAGAVVISAVVLAACASATGNPITGGTGGTGAHTTTVTASHGSSSSGTMGSGGSTGTASSGGTCDAPSAASDCSTQCASQTPCENCISTLEMTGYDNFNLYFFQKCGCATGSTCASSCSSDPACPNLMTAPGTACTNCLNNNIMKGDACITATQTACKGDPDCNMFLTDVQACFTLPTP